MPIDFQVGPNWVDILSRKSSPEEEVASCEKCGCQWLELIFLQRFPKFVSYVLGQKPGSPADAGFWLYKCPKCGSLTEPTIIHTAIDSTHKIYNELIDFLTKNNKPTGERV